jgi:hypothetical protein
MLIEAKVVPLASASIDSEWASDLVLDGNHLTICKFGGPDDPKYKDLRNTMQEFVKEIMDSRNIILKPTPLAG